MLKCRSTISLQGARRHEQQLTLSTLTGNDMGGSVSFPSSNFSDNLDSLIWLEFFRPIFWPLDFQGLSTRPSKCIYLFTVIWKRPLALWTLGSWVVVENPTPNPNVTVALSDRNAQSQSQMPTQRAEAKHRQRRRGSPDYPSIPWNWSSVTALTGPVICRQATPPLLAYTGICVTRCCLLCKQTVIWKVCGCT